MGENQEVIDDDNHTMGQNISLNTKSRKIKTRFDFYCKKYRVSIQVKLQTTKEIPRKIASAKVIAKFGQTNHCLTNEKLIFD